jgi:hypothetical protein
MNGWKVRGKNEEGNSERTKGRRMRKRRRKSGMR